jgi:hypothetical protein
MLLTSSPELFTQRGAAKLGIGGNQKASNEQHLLE